jgi:hypothetical protein
MADCGMGMIIPAKPGWSMGATFAAPTRNQWTAAATESITLGNCAQSPSSSRRKMMNLLEKGVSIISTETLPWPELRIPNYTLGEYGRWSIEYHPIPLVRGYFRGLQFLKIPNYVLRKNQTVWMSLTPMELESQCHHVAAAHGRVAVLGAGLGVTAYNLLRKKSVSKVFLFERDHEVIELLVDQGIYKWPNAVKKLDIHLKDAFSPDYPDEIDYLYADIWMRLGDRRALKEVKQIFRLSKAETISWWGMELDFVDWLRKRKKPPVAKRGDWMEWGKSIKLPIPQWKGVFMEKWALKAAYQFSMA